MGMQRTGEAWLRMQGTLAMSSLLALLRMAWASWWATAVPGRDSQRGMRRGRMVGAGGTGKPTRVLLAVLEVGLGLGREEGGEGLGHQVHDVLVVAQPHALAQHLLHEHLQEAACEAAVIDIRKKRENNLLGCQRFHGDGIAPVVPAPSEVEVGEVKGEPVHQPALTLPSPRSSQGPPRTAGRQRAGWCRGGRRRAPPSVRGPAQGGGDVRLRGWRGMSAWGMVEVCRRQSSMRRVP